MAEKIVRIDDLDASTDDVQHLTFSLGKDTYGIDLNAHHRWELKEALAPYIAVATKHKTKPIARTRTDTTAIRAWAQTQGIDLPERGRIPTSVRKQWQQEANK